MTDATYDTDDDKTSKIIDYISAFDEEARALEARLNVIRYFSYGVFFGAFALLTSLIDHLPGEKNLKLILFFVLSIALTRIFEMRMVKFALHTKGRVERRLRTILELRKIVEDDLPSGYEPNSFG